MPIKFITLTCEKYHQTRLKTIKETWGKGQDFVFLSDFNEGEDIVGFSHIPRGYEYVPLKYLEFFKYYNISEADWYFFTDDDTFVNIPKIESLLKKYDPNDNICLGHIGKLNPDGTDADGQQTGFPLQTIQGQDSNLPLTYVSGGAGFILSKKAFDEVRKYLLRTQSPAICYNGDVSFGFWLRGGQVQIIDILGFWWTNPNSLSHTDETINKSFTYHYLNQDDMANLYNITSKKQDLKYCLITQSKDQSHRLRDWVLYHHAQGFDTIIYYDDFSEDDSINVLNDLKNNFGINIIIKYSDGMGNKKSMQDMSNSESYGGDVSINYRILRSYNSGLQLAKSINPNSICAFLDVDEFLVSDEEDKITNTIEKLLENNNTDLLYIHSFDIFDQYNLGAGYITQENTALRWDYDSRDKSIYSRRGKSITIARGIDEILQRPNYVHQLREYRENEESKIHYRKYSKLRIHHFRKPNLESDIEYFADYTLINKSRNIFEKYTKNFSSVEINA